MSARTVSDGLAIITAEQAELDVAASLLVPPFSSARDTDFDLFSSHWTDAGHEIRSTMPIELLSSASNFSASHFEVQQSIAAPQPLSIPLGFEPDMLMPVEQYAGLEADHALPHPHNLPRIRDGAISARIRTNHACDPCRRRKAKCTGTEPCERCASRNISCVYSKERKMRGPNKPKPALLVRTEHSRRRADSLKSDGTPSPLSAGYTISSPSTPMSLPNTQASIRSVRTRQRAATIAGPIAPMASGHLAASNTFAFEAPVMPLNDGDFASMLAKAVHFDIVDGLFEGPYTSAHSPLDALPPPQPNHDEALALHVTRQARSVSISVPFADFDALSLHSEAWAYSAS